MNIVLPILFTAALAFLGAVLMYRRGMNVTPASYSLAAHSVTTISPSDVSQQIDDLRKLMAINAISVDAASVHLAKVWDVSRQEAREILVREL
jgi:hypothetical protein